MRFGSKGVETDDRSPKFIAKYDGVCKDCGYEFGHGEYIGYVNGDLLCEECWEDAG